MTQQKLLCEMTVIHADHGKGKKKVLFFQVQPEIGFNVTEYARKYF